MRRFASFGTTHVIQCIITNFACLSGNKLTNWCPSSRRVFKSIKVIFHCSWAVHLERNISFKESIHNCNCGFPWLNLSLWIICCLWQLPLCIFSGFFFLCQQYKLFFHWHLFFYFKSNNNCRLLTVNIVSFIFFYYRESKPPFCLHYEKSSPLNIVYRKINWQNPASISAYTQSEYRISNYVNHIRIINT